MKRLLMILSIILLATGGYAQSTPDQYMYIDTPIDAKLLLMNLRHNAQKYVKYMGFWGVKADEFYSSLEKYEAAIEEGRLSSDQSGAIIDKKGVLNNGKPLMFDKKGTYVTDEQYEKLSKKKKNQCVAFYPNREVVRYIDGLAGAIFEKLMKTNSPEYKRDAEILNSFKQSGVRKH